MVGVRTGVAHGSVHCAERASQANAESDPDPRAALEDGDCRAWHRRSWREKPAEWLCGLARETDTSTSCKTLRPSLFAPGSCSSSRAVTRSFCGFTEPPRCHRHRRHCLMFSQSHAFAFNPPAHPEPSSAAADSVSPKRRGIGFRSSPSHAGRAWLCGTKKPSSVCPIFQHAQQETDKPPRVARRPRHPLRKGIVAIAVLLLARRGERCSESRTVS